MRDFHKNITEPLTLKRKPASIVPISKSERQNLETIFQLRTEYHIFLDNK